MERGLSLLDTMPWRHPNANVLNRVGCLSVRIIFSDMRNLSMNEWVAVVAALAVIAVFFFLGNPLKVVSRADTNGENAKASDAVGEINVPDVSQPSVAAGQQNAEKPSVTQAPKGLVIEDTLVGKGEEAQTGELVTVNYTGKLTDGKVFDSSVGRDPFQFVLGQGRVIQGWEKGILGMKVGGKRRLTIPPDLAYGNQQIGPIPANSTLIFEVELLGAQRQ